MKCGGTVIHERAPDVEAVHESCGDNTDVARMCNIEGSLKDGCELHDVRENATSILQYRLLAIPESVNGRCDWERRPLHTLRINLVTKHMNQKGHSRH